MDVIISIIRVHDRKESESRSGRIVQWRQELGTGLLATTLLACNYSIRRSNLMINNSAIEGFSEVVLRDLVRLEAAVAAWTDSMNESQSEAFSWCTDALAKQQTQSKNK